MKRTTKHQTNVLDRTSKKSSNTTKKVTVNRAPRVVVALSYIPISHHVYYDGSSFRTRVRVNGVKHSWNTSDKKKAIEYRDYLLMTR